MDLDFNQPAIDKPISDDQELAKALAGVTQTPDSSNLSFEETPIVTEAENNSADSSDVEKPANQDESKDNATENSTEVTSPVEVQPVADNTSAESEDLQDIKKDALQDLKPLVEKLDIKPEEKFDIYLLLLRSTDDKTLVPAAYEAARNITDESARAQALLDVVKEIDYFSAPQQPAVEQ